MAHGRQVINFIGLGLLHDADEIGAVGQIPVVQLETDMLFMRVHIQMVDPVGMISEDLLLTPCTIYPFSSSNSARYAPS